MSLIVVVVRAGFKGRDSVFFRSFSLLSVLLNVWRLLSNLVLVPITKKRKSPTTWLSYKYLHCKMKFSDLT